MRLLMVGQNTSNDIIGIAEVSRNRDPIQPTSKGIHMTPDFLAIMVDQIFHINKIKLYMVV